ncbi:MAG TPA: hypothetical protein DEB06_03790 [Phycisphaerales bacterium]|nr:hypothetical protein [Phycisphaerales bacterium]
MTDAVRVVCFDLGGVVVRICRSWEEACAGAGVPVRAPERLARPDLAERRRALVRRYETGGMSCAEYWAALAGATGGAYTPEEVERVHLAWILEDYPQMEALIERLNRLPGLRTACLSNTNHAHWVSLVGGRFPAVGRIAHHIASHAIGVAKPHEEAYAIVERALGVRGPEVAYFDDLQENIDAALARGWRAARVDHDADPAAQIGSVLREWGVPA